MPASSKSRMEILEQRVEVLEDIIFRMEKRDREDQAKWEKVYPPPNGSPGRSVASPYDAGAPRTTSHARNRRNKHLGCGQGGR